MVKTLEVAFVTLLVAVLLLMMAQLTVASNPEWTVKYNRAVSHLFNWLTKLLVLPEQAPAPGISRGQGGGCARWALHPFAPATGWIAACHGWHPYILCIAIVA